MNVKLMPGMFFLRLKDMRIWKVIIRGKSTVLIANPKDNSDKTYMMYGEDIIRIEELSDLLPLMSEKFLKDNMQLEGTA